MSKHYLFVYGTLMGGDTRSGALEGPHNAFICNGITFTDELTMFNTGGFPVLLRGHEETSMPVQGEVWLVDDVTMDICDRIESEGVMYKKEELEINSMDGEHTLNCWVYVGVPEFWRDRAGLRTEAKQPAYKWEEIKKL